MLKRFLPVAVCAALLAACGSSSVKNVNTTTTAVVANAADQALAKKLVITSDDLPAVWVASQASASSASASQASASSANNIAAGVYDQLGTCLGASNATTDRTVLYSGESFSSNNNAISSGVSGFKTAATPTTEVTGIKNTANYPCIKNIFDSFVGSALSGAAANGAAPQSTLGTIPGLTVTDSQFDLRVQIQISTGGSPQTVYSDLIGTGAGRFVTTASINYFGTAPDLALEKQILQALTTKSNSVATS